MLKHFAKTFGGMFAALVGVVFVYWLMAQAMIALDNRFGEPAGPVCFLLFLCAATAAFHTYLTWRRS
jgi:hypothetical protein